MKLEAEFIAKDNLLYTVSGAPVPVNGIRLVSGEDICAAGSDSAEAQRVLDDGALHAGIPVGVTVPWTLVEPQPEQYNEEALAVLRDFLKRMEELGQHAVIVPVAEQADDEEERDRLTAASRTAVPLSALRFPSVCLARLKRSCRSSAISMSTMFSLQKKKRPPHPAQNLCVARMGLYCIECGILHCFLINVMPECLQ